MPSVTLKESDMYIPDSPSPTRHVALLNKVAIYINDVSNELDIAKGTLSGRPRAFASESETKWYAHMKKAQENVVTAKKELEKAHKEMIAMQKLRDKAIANSKAISKNRPRVSYNVQGVPKQLNGVKGTFTKTSTGVSFKSNSNGKITKLNGEFARSLHAKLGNKQGGRGRRSSRSRSRTHRCKAKTAAGLRCLNKCSRNYCHIH